MKARKRTADRGGIDLLEESILLLRDAPAAAWLAWLAGIVPFVSALLWFGADALRNPAADANLTAHSLIAAAAFVWKQLMESLFLSRLRGKLAGSEPPARAGAVWQALTRQTAVQSFSLASLPLAFSALVAAAPVVFFHRNFSLLAWDAPEDAASEAWRLARLDGRQAWIFLGMVSLIWLLLYVNLLVATIMIATFARSIFGVEELLANPYILAASGTVHWGIFLACYAAADLLLDAGAAVRCFHGESMRSGTDLLAAMRRIAAAVAVFALLVPMAAPAMAQTDRQQLDDSIERTLRKPEFSWRMPAPRADAPAIVNWTEDAWYRIGRGIGRVMRAIADWLRPDDFRPSMPKDGGGSVEWARVAMIGLAVVAALAAIVVVVRSRSGRDGELQAEAAPAAAAVNLEDQSLLPDRLSEDSWLKLADEWIAKGDYRLALRAMHLACLRMLSEKRLITIQRWKTCEDYAVELRRKSRQTPRLAQGFTSNSRLFDLGWYGFRPVEPSALDEFRSRLEEIRADAG